MRIPYEHFKDHVPTTVGQQVRINHDACPAGRDTKQRLFIKRAFRKVLAYCHNCGGHHVRGTGKGGVREAEVIRELLAKDERETRSASEVLLPADIKYNPAAWPDDARAWLYQYDIDDTDIAEYSIGYSESWGRVILPVYASGKCVFWQGRQIDGPAPKYISVRCAKKPLFTAPTYAPTSDRVVITEDMLSAIRVAKTGCADAVALLGTGGPDDLPVRLAGYKDVICWLDKDYAGKTASFDLRHRLATVMHANVWWCSADEPKRCTDQQIKDYTDIK